MLVTIARFSQRVAEGEAEIERPRRRSLLGDLPNDGERHGGYSRRLDCPGRQTDGPVARPSGRDQEGVIDPGFGKPPGDCRGGPFPECRQAGAVDMAHQSVGAGVEGAQGA